MLSSTSSSPLLISGSTNPQLSKSEILKEATIFITQIYTELKKSSKEIDGRLQLVKSEIDETGTYQHTTEELTYGCKVAWRNSVSCIGKVHWQVLTVHDKRNCKTEEEIAQALKDHAKFAYNDGNVMSTVTLFRPVSNADGSDEIRIHNPQIIRYAGYKNNDGSVLGDPDHVALTEHALSLGWKKQPKSRFDILPLMIQIGVSGKTKFFDLEPEFTTEVTLEHPKYPQTSDMALRWHGLPAITNMRFEMGGIFYTASAFNGWYMTTEITRNFLDDSRYNLLDEFGRIIGVRPDSDSESKKNPLWKDIASAEFNVMVQHSFDKEKVKMVDHHTAGKQFVKHMQNEEKKARECPARYSWIVPPSASHTNPVFHTRMKEIMLKPTISYQPEIFDGRLLRSVLARGEVLPTDPDWNQVGRSNGVKSKMEQSRSLANQTPLGRSSKKEQQQQRTFLVKILSILVGLLALLLMIYTSSSHNEDKHL